VAGGAPVPRPAPVRVAAALGVALAGYTLVYSLLLFTGVSIAVGYAVAGALYLAISGLTAGGVVRALTGRGGGLLVAGGAVFTLLTAVGLVGALLGGSGIGVWPLVLVAAGLAVAVLPTRPASRAFFATARDRG
jgi:hypothetical protein